VVKEQLALKTQQATASAETLKSAQNELSFSQDVAKQYETQNDALQRQLEALEARAEAAESAAAAAKPSGVGTLEDDEEADAAAGTDFAAAAMQRSHASMQRLQDERSRLGQRPCLRPFALLARLRTVVASRRTRLFPRLERSLNVQHPEARPGTVQSGC